MALEMLRKELRSGRFTMKKEIVLQSNNPDMDDQKLIIYKYKHSQPAQAGAVIHMNIPLIHGSIAVPLNRLLKR